MRFFQFHLSTCLILLIAAGALLWLNMRPHFNSQRIENTNLITAATSSYGWPYAAVSNKAFLWSPELISDAAKAEHLTESELMKKWVRDAYSDKNVKDAFYEPQHGFVLVVHSDVAIDRELLIFNVSFAAAVLILAGIALEIAVRRRQRAHPRGPRGEGRI